MPIVLTLKTLFKFYYYYRRPFAYYLIFLSIYHVVNRYCYVYDTTLEELGGSFCPTATYNVFKYWYWFLCCLRFKLKFGLRTPFISFYQDGIWYYYTPQLEIRGSNG